MDRYKGTDVAAYLLRRYGFAIGGVDSTERPAAVEAVEDVVWEMGREALNAVRVTVATAQSLTEDAKYVLMSEGSQRLYEPPSRDNLATLAREAARRERELHTLLPAIGKLGAESQRLAADARDARLAAAEAVDAHRAANALYEKAKRDVENLSADRDQLTAALISADGATSERDLLSRQLKETHQETATLLKEAVEDQQELADAHATATGLRAELQEARRELEVLRNDNERLREERGTFEQEAHDLRQERDNLIDARDVAQEALRDALDRVQKQQNRADDAEEKLAREEAMNRR